MVDKLEIFMKRPRMDLIRYLPCMMKIDYLGMICNIFRQWTILRTKKNVKPNYKFIFYNPF